MEERLSTLSLRGDLVWSIVPYVMLQITSLWVCNFMELLLENHNGAMNKIKHDLKLLYNN